MTYRYENTCDICGKITKGMADDQGNDLDHWDISISTHWLDEEKDGMREYKSDRKIALDSCGDCAKFISQKVKLAVEDRKSLSQAL